MALDGLKEQPKEPAEKPETKDLGTAPAGATTDSFPATVVVQLAWPNFVFSII